MKIEFKSFNEFTRGILYQQLLDAYSFNPECCHAWEKDWIEYDNFSMIIFGLQMIVVL